MRVKLILCNPTDYKRETHKAFSYIHLWSKIYLLELKDPLLLTFPSPDIVVTEYLLICDQRTELKGINE